MEIVESQNAVGGNPVVLNRSVTLMDNGTWRCLVSNVAGGASKDFVVTVLGKALWIIP